MGFKLKIFFDDGSDEVLDEVFETEQDAENEYDVWLDSWRAGRETLKLAGEDYDDSEIEDYEVFEE